MLVPILLIGIGEPAVAAFAGQDREGTAALRATRMGKILPLKEVERRVIPMMKDAQYIGFDLEMPACIYTLKFLRDGSVIWVEVDGRNGQVLGRTGH